jgi:V/A-type H+/Na+-transporting ATPase subunit K
MEDEMKNPEKQFTHRVRVSVLVMFAFMVIFGTVGVFNVFSQEAGTEAAEEIPENRAQVTKFALIGAAIAFGFGAIGAGIAIGNVGAAAMGSIAEKPEIAGQALIFIALAEGLVVFGFITALMILGKV